MDTAPSQRLVEQRLRNRIMEELHSLATWQGYLVEWGADEYFNGFFDFVPHEGVGLNSAMTERELAALIGVQQLVIAACDATPRMVTAEQLIETGWPERIAPAARLALDLMWERGQFSEEQEEVEPTLKRTSAV